MTSDARSKYRLSVSRTSSASRPSENGVNPTRSANSTETIRRSAIGGRAGAAPAAAPDGVVAAARPGSVGIASPQDPQNLAFGSFGSPHAEQLVESGVPHSRQNRRDAAFVAPQLEQTIRSSPRPAP